jgi:superfamily II DNA or RNA helicase
MAKKDKSPAVWAVRTPEALQSLDQWLRSFDPKTYDQGKNDFADEHVAEVWAAADHFIEAVVDGPDFCEVTLFLTRGKWTSACTCPKKKDCKHVVAAGLEWVTNLGQDVEDSEDFDYDDYVPRITSIGGIPLPGLPARKPGAHGPRSKQSFVEEWAPKIAQKLGRKLDPAELRQMRQLDELFTEFARSFNSLYEAAVRRHGFAEAIPPSATPWGPLFSGWWNQNTAPANPRELWQYLAYSLQLLGRPIPEVFRPLTNTARVHASLEALLQRQQMETWRHALAEPGVPSPSARPSPLIEDVVGLRARLDTAGDVFIETQAAPDKPWKPPTQKWTGALVHAQLADFETLEPAAAALAIALAMSNRHGFRSTLKYALPPEIAEAILATRAARPAIVLPDGGPFVIEAESLVSEATPSTTMEGRLEVRLVRPDGTPALGAQLIVKHPVPLYLHDGRVWPGPLPLPTVPLPMTALGDTLIMSRLRERGVRLPATIEAKVRRVSLRPRLKCWLVEPKGRYDYGAGMFCAQLFASSNDPRCTQTWRGLGGWQWAKNGAPPPRQSDDPLFEFDLGAANAVGAHFVDFRLNWTDWEEAWTRAVTKTFPEDFLAWHAALPPGLTIDVAPELAGFFGPALRASVDFSAIATDANHDWFDLTVALRVEDTTLNDAEIELLLKARGKWVRLRKKGWQRLDLANLAPGEAMANTLDRLGLTSEDVYETGRATTHRLHALQLAGEAATLEARDATLAASLRARVAALAAQPPPPLPATLTATLRPYQIEGYHFLSHLSAQGFGGVLADDMGLGKTVQTLAWLLHLAGIAHATGKKIRVLVVCPKSVTHGWLAEAARFAPSLAVAAFTPALTATEVSALRCTLLVANYAQLRLNAEWFKSAPWDVVVLDEGQFIKNPTSKMAVAARALPSRHRLVLTGTPIENRLSDLWSLFAFAQPGLLGAQASFRRQYDEKDPAALARLHRRVNHFLLRRTKAQAAPDLPPRTEDEIVVELEPAQRQLYDAELKHARSQLLGVETARALDKVRFNILASLLRLRQICCHPALVDPAHAALPSAKLEALLERLDELRDEGHQVLVFSQFVTMLEIIRTRLTAAGIGHLMLTGQTENRAELVEKFQSDRTKTVFLLSLKAAGFGLNLTAASYAILYDPWWNPAVETQAIDRTHRIGQTRPVFAYRLLAENTVEQKIRALQQEKAALAAAVVQEESLSSVLDLDSLRQILA